MQISDKQRNLCVRIEINEIYSRSGDNIISSKEYLFN